LSTFDAAGAFRFVAIELLPDVDGVTCISVRGEIAVVGALLADLPLPRYEVIPAAPKISIRIAAALGKRSCCFCSTEQKSQKRRLVSGVHFARIIFSPQ
jgi:hypothetical protein